MLCIAWFLYHLFVLRVRHLEQRVMNTFPLRSVQDEKSEFRPSSRAQSCGIINHNPINDYFVSAREHINWL
jgi:hypothetical protein